MFTFSFGSAFATISWTGEATNKYLTEEGDYKAPAGSDKGEEGITEAYRAELTSNAKAELRFVKGSTTPFFAPEKAEAVAAIEAYIEALKTVKTAKDADKLEKDLKTKVDRFCVKPCWNYRAEDYGIKQSKRHSDWYCGSRK